MRRQISIAELQRAGVTFQVSEALAIIRQLIAPPEPASASDPEPPFGPPSSTNVFLEPDGAVSCTGCQATAAVSELAIFLQTLLPSGGAAVSGSLRYTIARALLDVDAPPFDSVDQFAAALARHEQGDPKTVVRHLLDRVSRGENGEVVWIERRRTPPELTDLRRQLRVADERVYEQQLAIDALAAMTAQDRPRTSRRLVITITAAMLLMLVGVADAMRSRRAIQSPSPLPTAPSPRAIDTSTDARATAPPPPQITKELKDTKEPNKTPSTTSPDSKVTPPRAPRVERPSGPRVRRAASPGWLNRLRLGWLRGKVAIRSDAL